MFVEFWFAISVSIWQSLLNIAINFLYTVMTKNSMCLYELKIQ